MRIEDMTTIEAGIALKDFANEIKNTRDITPLCAVAALVIISELDEMGAGEMEFKARGWTVRFEHEDGTYEDESDD